MSRHKTHKLQYCPISTWYDSQGGLAYDHTTTQVGPKRRGALAGQEAPPVADGTDRPDGAVRDAADRLGDEPARLARRRPGAVVDRADPALHPAADPRPAVRARRAEPARRGDGAAGERQVLPLLHLRLHPVPVPQRDPGRLPVHRVEPELARLRRRRWAGRARSAWRCRSASLGGVGINTAHEMGHKKDSLERWLSKITLAQTCYGHFYIEHNRGHHVRVATPEDPASARFGETFWEFLPRSVFGSLRSALRLEAQRLRRQGAQPVEPQDLSVQRRAQRLADVGGAVGCADRGVRPGADPVRDHPGGLRLQPAGGGQLPRALRAAAAEERQRPLRALHAGAQLELRPHRHQPVPVPPAAAQRSPRQPDPALPDAAQHGRARPTCPADTRR